MDNYIRGLQEFNCLNTTAQFNFGISIYIYLVHMNIQMAPLHIFLLAQKIKLNVYLWPFEVRTNKDVTSSDKTNSIVTIYAIQSRDNYGGQFNYMIIYIIFLVFFFFICMMMIHKLDPHQIRWRDGTMSCTLQKGSDDMLQFTIVLGILSILTCIHHNSIWSLTINDEMLKQLN